jgi:hypothetical protein
MSGQQTEEPVSVLVDYVCPTCAGRFEQWITTPAPATGTCPACGGVARRAWSPIGLTRGGSPTPAPAPDRSRDTAALCARNPDVPGLCHMSPDAARGWIARARKDNRTLEGELAKQEAAAAIRPPRLEDVVSHSHSHG